MNRVAVYLRRGSVLTGKWTYMSAFSCRNIGDDSKFTTVGKLYCSTAHNQSVNCLRLSLLDGALKHVSERGWSDAALVAAARDLGLSPAVIGLLPRGEGELVEHFIEQCNSQCITELETRKAELVSMDMNERVSKALRIRLELLTPVIDTWPQALAVAARPGNASHSLKLMFSMVDDVLAALNDGSTDVTWYSKRALLAGVYASTSLYMITDYSPGFKDTWEALQRRVDEALALDSSLKRIVRTTSSTPGSTSAPP